MFGLAVTHSIVYFLVLQSLSEMETSLASSSAETTIPLTEESSITSAAELTTLSANGREAALLSSITQSAGIGELGAGGQFLLPSSGVDSNQSSGKRGLQEQGCLRTCPPALVPP